MTIHRMRVDNLPFWPACGLKVGDYALSSSDWHLRHLHSLGTYLNEWQLGTLFVELEIARTLLGHAAQNRGVMRTAGVEFTVFRARLRY